MDGTRHPNVRCTCILGVIRVIMTFPTLQSRFESEERYGGRSGNAAHNGW